MAQEVSHTQLLSMVSGLSVEEIEFQLKRVNELRAQGMDMAQVKKIVYEEATEKFGKREQ